VNATAYTRYGGFSEGLIAVFSEAVAYEMFLNYVEQLAIDIERAASTAQTNAESALTVKHIKELKERISYIRQLAVDKSAGVYDKMATAGAFITQVEHIEKSLRGNLAADLAANMAFSSRR
jgi:conjugative transfer pilus assembly protein TraH